MDVQIFKKKKHHTKINIKQVTIHTFSFHAHRQTFHVATVLASVSLTLIYDTVSVISTGVGQIFSHSSFEETFTTFTTEKKISSNVTTI